MTTNDRSGSWLFLLVLFTVAGLLETIFWGQVNAFTPLYLPVLGVAEAEIPKTLGLIAAIGSGIGLPMLPFWGALADRYARKPIILRSFIVYVIGCLVASAATGVPSLILGRAIMGLSLGNSGLMMTTLSDRVPAARRALAFGVFNSAPPLGAFLGPLIGGPFADSHGVGALLFVDGMVMLVVVLALWLGYRDEAVGRVERSVWEMARESLVILWSSPRLRTLFPALFFLFAGWMIANLYLPMYIGAYFPTKTLATRIGWVLASGGIGTVILAPTMGALADRRGVWPVLFACCFIVAAAWFLPMFAPTLALLTLAWAVINGLSAATMSLAFMALSDSAPDTARARVMAFAYLPSTAGYVIAASVGSMIRVEVVSAIFPAAGLLTLIGAVGIVFSSRQSKDPM